MCVCVCACVRACVRVCVFERESDTGCVLNLVKKRFDLLHTGCTGQGRTLSLPGNRDSAWCCRSQYDIDTQGTGSDTPD